MKWMLNKCNFLAFFIVCKLSLLGFVVVSSCFESSKVAPRLRPRRSEGLGLPLCDWIVFDSSTHYLTVIDETIIVRLISSRSVVWRSWAISPVTRHQGTRINRELSSLHFLFFSSILLKLFLKATNIQWISVAEVALVVARSIRQRRSSLRNATRIPSIFLFIFRHHFVFEAFFKAERAWVRFARLVLWLHRTISSWTKVIALIHAVALIWQPWIKAFVKRLTNIVGWCACHGVLFWSICLHLRLFQLSTTWRLSLGLWRDYDCLTASHWIVMVTIEKRLDGRSL